MGSIKPYLSIARPDHWFKNVFMIPGILLAFLFTQAPFTGDVVITIILAFFSTCFIASANYTINELIDAPFDKLHPIKKLRPVPSGQVKTSYAMVMYFILIILGLGIAYTINIPFLIVDVIFVIMGLMYNVPPFRTKDIVYLDVLSESVNNSIRLLLGWYAVTSDFLPPLSIIIAYWMIGAFFMATKRLGEIRYITDKDTVKNYRKSLGAYTQESLLISMFFYASIFSFTLAIFLVRYKFELILTIPVLALLISDYLRIGFIHDSPVQYPERLYKQKRLMVLCGIFFVMFIILLFADLPWVASIFDPQHSINR